MKFKEVLESSFRPIFQQENNIFSLQNIKERSGWIFSGRSVRSSARKEQLDWQSECEVSIDGVSFFATVNQEIYHARKSDENSLLIVKTREMIETELQLVSHLDVKNVIDIGVWQGGSVAMLDILFKPERIVAIEYSTRELPALDAYIAKKDRSANVKLHKGINQADHVSMRRILLEEFKEAPIDLAIDDASHQFEETKISFNLIFPRLRENGIFIIEDWQWSTMPIHYESEYFKDRKGLANLILLCVMACAARPDIVKEVIVFPHSVAIKRGGAELSHDTFDISEFSLNKGEEVPLIL